MGQLLTAREAAARLRVDVRTLYAYVSRGAVASTPAGDGRTSRYDADEIELVAQRSRPRTLPRPASSIDVVVGSMVSEISDGQLWYRGTDAIASAKLDVPFEDVVTLLWNGSWGGLRLTSPERRRIDRLIAALPRDASPARRLIAAVLANDDTAATEGVRSGGSLLATLIEASGTHFVGSPPAESIAGQVWARISPLKATPKRLVAVNRALVLMADHELAASTIAVRVAASARATPVGCIIAGLAVLDGELHGHVGVAVHRSLLGLADRRADPLDAQYPAAFGHSVHRSGDPRTQPLLDAVLAAGTDRDRDIIDHAVAVGSAQREGAAANVDFALGALTYMARAAPTAPLAIFAVARAVGWWAHAQEEYAEKPLRLRGRAVARPR